MNSGAYFPVRKLAARTCPSTRSIARSNIDVALRSLRSVAVVPASCNWLVTERVAANMTSNNGERPVVLCGATRSMIVSKGMSRLSQASKNAVRARPSRSMKVVSPSTFSRIARVLVKFPHTPSISDASRISAGIPITTSVASVYRCSTAASPASAIVNGVVLCSSARSRSPATAASGKACRHRPLVVPRCPEDCAVTGKPTMAGAGVNRSTQYCS
ncbi:Uncharacterised protein [Mycobacteroides abscessus subsp. abscessus]|nr:Uncharacterised protein [Mycobacteroides abscessus subsp. abscessus]